MNKKAQEEIIGFGIILVIIAIVALIFISISINKAQKEEVEDYEASSFLKVLMEKTTECEKNAKFLAVKDTVFECGREYTCLNGESACELLNDTLEETMNDNWKVGVSEPIKGYNLVIEYEGELYFNISEGSITQEYKGAMQEYSKINENTETYLNIYT